MKKISILGTVGIPASYGGFETLTENLAKFHQAHNILGKLVVYCSAKSYPTQPQSYLGANLRYIKLYANGVSSIPYDIISLISAILHRSDVILLLGVSGAIALPLVRLFSRARIVTNIDGIEWKREKWTGLARWYLKLSERIAVFFSHEVVADNLGIAEHVAKFYGRQCHVIAYGGDNTLNVLAKPFDDAKLPSRFALAICRIEPENNVVMILEAFATNPDMPIIFIGNWNSSKFGFELKQRFCQFTHLHLLDPIYDLGVLYTLRSNAAIYVHGHSAGGTNPSLVEIMHFGIPIFAYDCIFNRHTTDNKALWFRDVESLRLAISSLNPAVMTKVGADMKCIAQERYTWEAIGQAYFRLLLS